MGDGWETARRMDRPAVLEANVEGVLQIPGYEYAAFKFGVPASRIFAIEVDTNHFKGNYADSIEVQVAHARKFSGNDINVKVGKDQPGTLNFFPLGSITLP